MRGPQSTSCKGSDSSAFFCPNTQVRTVMSCISNKLFLSSLQDLALMIPKVFFLTSLLNFVMKRTLRA